ncbi:MAG: DUF3159 domain-containing protein [Terrimesophilobacter sp.]
MRDLDHTSSTDDDGSADVPVSSESLGFRESLGAAARKAGIGQVTPGEVPTAASLMKAVGGVRGLVEALVPGLIFLVVYTITGDVAPSVLIPVAVGALFVVARAVARTGMTSAIAGLIGIAISAAFALITGRAADNFVPGLITNVVSLVVLLVSLAVRWPLIGLIAGLLTNEGTAWRADRGKRRVLTVATWLWAGLFASRLAVQVPLYFADLPEWQAAAKLIMGIPLYAGLLWVTWLMVRAVYRRAQTPAD